MYLPVTFIFSDEATGRFGSSTATCLQGHCCIYCDSAGTEGVVFTKGLEKGVGLGLARSWSRLGIENLTSRSRLGLVELWEGLGLDLGLVSVSYPKVSFTSMVHAICVAQI